MRATRARIFSPWPPDGDLPVRHDAVCRRGAPLPLGAGRRPGADRRRQSGRIHLRKQFLHAPPSPDADRQTGRRHGGDGRDRRAFQRPGRRRDHRRNSLHRTPVRSYRGAEPRRRRLLDALDGAGRRSQPSLRQPPLRPRGRARGPQLHRGPQVTGQRP